MLSKKLDHAEKIMYLTMIIKNICDENNMCKRVVIEDFIDLMNEISYGVQDEES